MKNNSKKQINQTRPQTKRKKWKIVSFFSGCGGLDLGFSGGFTYKGINHETLPYQILEAYDNDEKCIDTYQQNMGKYHKLFNKKSAKRCDLSKFNPKKMSAADILIGGFPCQEFSMCGPRQGINSIRGKLYKALVKYAREHRPKILVAENVPGLAKIADGKMLEAIKNEIERSGYNVAIWNMFAPDYGIPQSRNRIFIIAVRKDLKGFPTPPRKHYLNKHRSTKWAIGDLEKIANDDWISNQSQFFMAGLAKNGNGQGDERSYRDKPAYTIRANAKSRVQFHYSLDRRLTIRECARLQTFPDNFVFPHAATTNIMQIGNAVPPKLAYVVAKSISKWLRQIDNK